jgi:Putative adhesin
MNSYFNFHKCFLAAILLCLAPCLTAQAPDNRIAVPLTDPARPATVRARLLNGSITVKGGDVKEVVVEARVRHEDERGAGRGEGRGEGRGQGMKRIPMTSTGLNIEAENNQVRISTDSYQRTVDLTITVPTHTSLSLKTVNDGNILVSGVDGELDVDDINGDVDLKNVGGSVVAHALNGHVVVSLNRLDPQKPMAFSSLNGDIDVTFPPDLKANVSMRTDNGEVYSDFDVKLQANSPQQTVEDGRANGGKYRVKIEKNVHGTINGGGQEIQFKNFNGNIYLRKAGAKQ